MLPKSKSNHNESTSLSNLNNVNNMMINYNSANLISSQSKLISSNDERYDCRALICDSNGIIIGETAYRCMICSQINDSIAETKQHYYENHSNEFLLNTATNNISNLNQNIATTNGNFITNSILNSSLNNSLNNGALQLSAAAAAAIHQNSNSLLSNNNESAKKRKNMSDVLDKIYCSKNVSSTSSNSKNRNSTSLIQSTGSLSNYLNNSQLNNQLNSQLISQLSNQNVNSQLNNFNNQLNNQLNNDDYDEEEPDDQKSDLDNEEWLMRTNNTINNLSNDLLNASTHNSGNAILDVINKTSLFMKLSENMNNDNNLSKDLKNKKLNNLFVDNSFETDYSNQNSYENIIGNDSENKDDLSRALPPTVKLKRGSTTANVGKPGHVSCAVCGVVRYYSCVYRRYGQFTCQVCYRFFRTFFAKPHRYTCTNLGSCPLDVRVRCRACWIQACINLYSVDGQRKQILDTYHPLNKSADESIDNNNNSTNVNDRNSKSSNKHNLDDDLENSSRNSKKIKKAANNFNDQIQQEYSNGDELEEEIADDDACIQEDEDQDEPLNMITKKNDLSDEDLKDDEEC